MTFSKRVALLFFVCMLPCTALFLKAQDYAHEQFEDHFRSDASMSATIIANSMLAHLQDIGSLGRYLEASNHVSHDEFEAFIGPILSARGGVQAYEWVPVVRDAERQEFEARARGEWGSDYRITQRRADGSLVPADPRDVYYPILHLKPVAGNKATIGFDLGSDPARLAALERARDTGQPVASERVTLVQGRNAAGFLVFTPVYDYTRPREELEDRRAALKGFALGVFRFEAMILDAMNTIKKDVLAVEVIDVTPDSGEQVLYGEPPETVAETDSRGILGYLERGETYQYGHNLEFAGRTWQVRVTAKPGYFDANYPWAYWLILPIGGTLTLLLSLFFAVMMRNKERLERRTAELGQVNDMLQGEIVDRRKAHRDTDMVLKAVSAILIGVDKFGLVSKWNGSAEKAFQMASDDVLGLEFVDMALPWDWTVVREGIEKCSADLLPVQVNNLCYTRPSGKDGFLLVTINPIIARINEGEHAIEGFLLLADDITEFKLLESQLSQSQKLESIGHLAAGIAHEINTPVQYVGDSAVFLKSAFEDCQRVMGMIEELAARGSVAGEGGCAGGLERIGAGLEEIDYPFLKEEVPKSFVRVLDGVERISTIVQAMKRFSHPGGVERKAVDINKAIENTLVVSRNEWKYVADVETLFAPDLPQVVCMPGDLNQVLLNVVVNAAHAIDDVVRGTQAKGMIRVSTRLTDGMVEIAVRDSGRGIPAAIHDKIFDPFFTTKEVGRGTGQGLTISYDIVVKKHGGKIFFESEDNQGATFYVQLPVEA